MLDIYASWTPQRRLKAVADMAREAREVMTAGVRQQNPGWSEAEVKKEVARRHLGYPRAASEASKNRPAE